MGAGTCCLVQPPSQPPTLGKHSRIAPPALGRGPGRAGRGGGHDSVSAQGQGSLAFLFLFWLQILDIFFSLKIKLH